MTDDHRLIKALKRQPVDKVPVWFMRQAGRYLPEYREVREKAGSFVNLCRNPELACEVTLQPLRRFDFDAAILFSDILTLPDAMGMGLSIVEKQGPQFQKTIRSQADVAALGLPDPETDMRYVMDAVRLIKQGLDGKVPLIGFAGSPWTVATYMIEGGPTKNFSRIKKMLYSNPTVLHLLLSHMAKATATYLAAQVAAGAEVVMLFDSWGGVLSPTAYQAFSLNYMNQVVDLFKKEVEQDVPVILYGKQTHYWLEKIVGTGCDAVGVDWTIGLKEVRERVGDRVAVQGNLDPAVLYSDPEVITEQVNTIMTNAGPEPGFVFNLGHGIMPDINPEHVKVAVDAVHAFEPVSV